MARPCTICAHAARVDIDRAILRAESVRVIGTRFGTTANAVQRHKAHVAGLVVAVLDKPGPPPPSMGEQLQGIDVRAEMLWCISEAKRLGGIIETSGDPVNALKKLTEVMRVVGTLGKFVELSRGAEAATRAIDVRSKNWLEHFQSPREALAWLETEGIPALRAAAAKDGA